MTNTSKKPVSSVKPSNQSGKWAFRGYVNVTLRKDEVVVAKAWADAKADDEVLDALLKLADSGYRFGVGEGSSGMTATLSNYDGPQESRGYVLSARASSARSAVLKLLYLHYEHLDGDWTVAIEAASGDDW